MSQSKLVFIESIKGVNKVSVMIIHNSFKYLCEDATEIGM